VLRVGQTASAEDEDVASAVVHGQVVTRGEKSRKGRQWLLYRRREGEGWDGGSLTCCGEKWEGRRVHVEWLRRRERPRWAVCGWCNRGVKERERKT
jgi:hypothetical protein